MAISATYSDMIRWYEERRWDILKEISFCQDAPQGDGFYFYKTMRVPKGELPVGKPCPFLTPDELCAIHETKPLSCKDAPKSLDRFDCCPVWDESFIDRKKIKVISKRQTEDYKLCAVPKNFERLLFIITKARKIDN